MWTWYRCSVSLFGTGCKKYLVFVDITKCFQPGATVTSCDTPQVCVKNCPDTFYVEGSLNNKKRPICEDEIKKKIVKKFSTTEKELLAILYLGRKNTPIHRRNTIHRMNLPKIPMVTL